MDVIKLSKIRLQLLSNEWFSMVIKALEYYRESLNYNIMPYQDDYKNEFKAVYSLVTHLINKYEARKENLYSATKPRLIECYHDALILREALQYYQAQTDNNLHAPRCGSLYEELDHQIIAIENRIASKQTIKIQ